MTKIVSKLKLLPPSDKLRQTVTQELLNKLYSMGLINSASSLLKAEKLAVSAICRFVGVGACLPSAELCLTPHCYRRRLPVVMVRLKMAENLKEAVTFIEQVHPWSTTTAAVCAPW